MAGIPFLTYLIRHLLSQGIERFIFSLGYKHELIIEFLEKNFSYLNYKIVIEEKPLGTGGAINLAITESADRDILIVNGDTLFKVDIDDLFDLHIETQSDCTLALKPMSDFDRYGSVQMDTEDRIIKFKEKRFTEKGFINGGVYLLNKISFLKNDFPPVFSFEKDYLESYLGACDFYGVVQDKYFIDIGIREDYERAQKELQYPSLDIGAIDKTWTLFLDRDGVINYNKKDSYVFHTGEFQFIPGSTEAIKRFSAIFGKIIIITNQRGIGKGLMDEVALGEIHQHMIECIENEGGRIDALYYCAIADDKHHDRKPNPGMALEAALMFHEINFSRTIMVGDKMSDMQLGRNIGAYTILIDPAQSFPPHPDVDLCLDSLIKLSDMFVHMG